MNFGLLKDLEVGIQKSRFYDTRQHKCTKMQLLVDGSFTNQVLYADIHNGSHNIIQTYLEEGTRFKSMKAFERNESWLFSLGQQQTSGEPNFDENDPILDNFWFEMESNESQ